MLAFAGNTVLCRAALANGLIDAPGFMTVRTVSAAVLLTALLACRGRMRWPRAADAGPAAALLVYMVCFSFAYLSLSTGTGALILFGAVQLTMLSSALIHGERIPPLSRLGFVIAAAGLVWLVAPGVTAPEPLGAMLMALAGMAWGVYSLKGRASGDATASTACNFALIVVPVLLVSAMARSEFIWTGAGVALAVVSGAVTSGLGYAVWYTVLPRLSASQASGVQLTVPVLSAGLGIVFLSEAVSFRLVSAAIATIGGVALMIAGRAGRATAARSDNR